MLNNQRFYLNYFFIDTIFTSDKIITEQKYWDPIKLF